MGTGSFPGVEAAGAWGWPPHPHLVPKVLEKSTALPLLTLRVYVDYEKGENLPYLRMSDGRQNTVNRSRIVSFSREYVCFFLSLFPIHDTI